MTSKFVIGQRVRFIYPYPGTKKHEKSRYKPYELEGTLQRAVPTRLGRYCVVTDNQGIYWPEAHNLTAVTKEQSDESEPRQDVGDLPR